MIPGLFLSKEKIISLDNGNVMHAIKKSSSGYKGFGEAYFSLIKYQSIKGWKKHFKMTVNLIVPIGKVKFVVSNHGEDNGQRKFYEFILSREEYNRLTIPPMVWYGFKGLSEPESVILNIANIEHVPNESETIELSSIEYDW